MRRSTESVEPVGSLFAGYARGVELLELEALRQRIAVLEPFATDARRSRLAEVLSRRIGSITVLLDSLHDPFNGAAVLRSCDVFGLARLHVVERHETFLVARSVSRGSEQWVDVITHRSGRAAASTLLEAGFELVAAHPDAAIEPSDLRTSTEQIALVLGNEHRGIDDDIGRHCKRAVKIPMRGFAESLNVSVTTAILLYELARDRPGDLSDTDRARLMLRGLIKSIPKGCDILDAEGLGLPR